MSARRLLCLPVFILLPVLVPVVRAGAADPPVCTVHLPATVSATSPYTAVWPTFTDCSSYPDVVWAFNARSEAAWIYHGRVEVKNGVSQGAWRFHDDYPTGRYNVANPNLPPAPTDPPQNYTTTVVKFGSWIALGAHRRDQTKVRLTGIASHYLASANAFRRWAHRPVAISYKTCADCPWALLAVDKTNDYGGFSLTAVSTTARYYRAKVGETSTTWSSISVPAHQ